MIAKRLRADLVGVLVLLLLPTMAVGREVSVPLTLDHEFLRQALLTQVYTGADHSVRVWDDGSGCNFLILSNPRVTTAGGRLRVISDGKGRVGTAVGASCLTLVDWEGTLEVDEQPSVETAQPIVRFRVVDSNLYDKTGRKRVTGTLWDWAKAYVHPRLEAVTVDLQQPVDQLRGFLPLILPRDSAEQTQALLDSLRLASADAVDQGVRVTLRFDVAEVAAAPTAPAPEPTLTADEVARWEAAWQQWDAFLTFVSKQAATDTAATDQRQALLAVLIEARYDILLVLRPTSANQTDPVPALFVKTWTRLAPVLRTLSLGLPSDQALHYLTFIGAADALQAITDLGPASGLDISADGLRRLARMIAPDSSEDPVAYSDAVDPALRQLFGFGDPLPTPAENPDVDLSAADVEGGASSPPHGRRERAGGADEAAPSTRAAASLWPALTRLWQPAAAWAASDSLARLNHWAPTRDDLDEYLPLVRDLLLQTAAQTLAKQALDPQFRDVYRWTVLATAWKESCWRQWVRVGDRVKPMTSPVGALGMMQVNPRVWRGFYDVKGLAQDIAYNAMAGAEIVVHYLRDYAIAKGEHTATGKLDNLARATYAVYNGGPGHLRRYRRDKTSRGLRQIDDSFWEKYEKVKKGQEMAVAECYGP